MKHQRKHLDVEVMGDKHVRGEGQCICWGSSREKKTALGISWTRVRVEKGGQNPRWTGEKPGKSSRRSEKKSDEELMRTENAVRQNQKESWRGEEYFFYNVCNKTM